MSQRAITTLDNFDRSFAEAYFYERIAPEPNSGCWLWTLASDGSGYGHAYFPGRGRIKAHRLAWLLFCGNTYGQSVLHRCDTPPCVNPSHLFLGTHDDNMADRSAKNRQARHFGESNPRAKLTIEQVREIRALVSSAGTRALADRFGVTIENIRAIVQGKTWRRDVSAYRDGGHRDVG
jgi:hypothetical protein